METDKTRLGDAVEKLNESIKSKKAYVSKFKLENKKTNYRQLSDGVEDYKEVKSSFKNMSINLQLRINRQKLAYQLVKLNNKKMH